MHCFALRIRTSRTCIRYFSNNINCFCWGTLSLPLHTYKSCFLCDVWQCVGRPTAVELSRIFSAEKGLRDNCKCMACVLKRLLSRLHRTTLFTAAKCFVEVIYGFYLCCFIKHLYIYSPNFCNLLLFSPSFHLPISSAPSLLTWSCTIYY